MFKRFATLALVALSVVTTGCATRQENALVGTVTGLAAGAALGNTGTALLGGVVGAVIGSNIPGTQERVVRVGGSAPYRVSYSSSSLSPDACNDGYRQVRHPNGATTWVCSGANVPNGLFAGHESTIVRGETIRMKAKCEFATFTAYADDASGCDKIAQAMTVKKASNCVIGKGSATQGLTQEGCDDRAKAATITKPGHCRVAGVDYPHLVDNEPGCKAKLAEVAAAANTQTASTVVKAADVKVDMSKGTAVANACAWVHPDTKKRFDKPSSFSGACLDFVKRVAGENGFAIAVRQ